VSIFLRIEASSTVDGEVLSFLLRIRQCLWRESLMKDDSLPAGLLRIRSDGDLGAFLLCSDDQYRQP
jgi:hypothetical protein